MEQNKARQKGSPSEKLLQGKSPEDREKFTRSYQRAKGVTSEQNRILSRELEATLKGGDNPQNFETPNWEYKAAWQAGYRHALRLSLDLTRQT